MSFRALVSDDPGLLQLDSRDDLPRKGCMGERGGHHSILEGLFMAPA